MDAPTDNPRLTSIAVVACAIALVGLGAISLAWADPLLQWQPVAKAAAWRPVLGVGSGAILLAAGLALVPPNTRRIAAMLASGWIATWVVLLHLPAAAGAGPLVPKLLGVAECSAMALGIATLLGPVVDSRAWRIAFGSCLVVFGISHFAYAQFTASMVPAWLPARLAIAYATGGVHALTGIAIAAGYRVRAAALLESAMMASFVALLHLPRVLFAPGDRVELTMLGIASLLTAATALVGAAASDPLPRVSRSAARTSAFTA